MHTSAGLIQCNEIQVNAGKPTLTQDYFTMSLATSAMIYQSSPLYIIEQRSFLLSNLCVIIKA